ncbi:hypothetical protein BRARA_E02191 [Brassica rapa]|uniref:Uncharacterized protein n=1 Tax=Brassica campestris TaxID=3711 RepID=A0A397ZC04_BRACM|nr:hypothetical protein BRARA_E02191 [Brassica rapa]
MNSSIIHAKGVKEDFVDGSQHGDLSYFASKRKVPRGPDPIHNRKHVNFDGQQFRRNSDNNSHWYGFIGKISLEICQIFRGIFDGL